MDDRQRARAHEVGMLKAHQVMLTFLAGVLAKLAPEEFAPAGLPALRLALSAAMSRQFVLLPPVERAVVETAAAAELDRLLRLAEADD